MCNLYRMTKLTTEVANLFGATIGQVGNAGGGEVYPRYPGLVVTQGDLRSMVWGFPLMLKGKDGKTLKPKPVNNARADKLDNFMWRFSFQERRCLIPVSALPRRKARRGPKRAPGSGFPTKSCSPSPGSGAMPPNGEQPSMVMTEACIHVADVHDRMPVILKRSDWGDWLDGPPDAAGLLCRPYPDLMVCDRTQDAWVRRSAKAGA